MSNILHPSAKTTGDLSEDSLPKVREEIYKSKESIKKLAKKYNVNTKTICKWKHRTVFKDKKSGPRVPNSILSLRDQKIICEFRRITQFPLDDVFIALKDQIPKLSRSNLHLAVLVKICVVCRGMD